MFNLSKNQSPERPKSPQHMKYTKYSELSGKLLYELKIVYLSVLTKVKKMNESLLHKLKNFLS